MSTFSGSLFDDAFSQTSSPRAASAPLPDGFLFSGNRHESVPRALFFDARLTPLERNAWQICRVLLKEDGITTLPTYEQLRPLLTSMPCGARASHETVARAMMVLRLTRWFSLVRRHCRDRRTGRILGNLYVLHDEPLTPYEAIELDPDYLALVSRALAHPTLSVRRVGFQVLKEMSEDPHLTGRELPSRLHLLMQRLRAREAGAEDAGAAATYPQDEGRRESEEGLSDSEESPHDAEESGKTSEISEKTLLRNRKTPASESESPSSESEAGEKPAPDGRLRNPKRDSTVRTVQNNDLKVRTVPCARERLELPQAFLKLKREQQTGALLALEQIDGGQRQAVLDEWAARCRDDAIRNPAGYLYGIIQKALRGEFKAWAGPRGERRQPPPPAPDAGRQAAKERPAKAEDKPAGPEAVQKYLAQLRSILKYP